MAKKKTVLENLNEKLYALVEELRGYPDKKAVLRRVHRSSDPVVKRALRIHRHLRALEEDILASVDEGCVDIAGDEKTGQIVVTIRNEELHACRMAYLNRRELAIIESNPEVAQQLRTCPAHDHVA